MSLGNPLVSQGTLNRIIASVVVPDNPTLNVTAPFLGKAGVTLSLEGETTNYIQTLTGAVTSPDPYQMATIGINLLKSQNLASLYKAQMETLATIGDVTVYPDTFTLPAYVISNCAIASVREMSFAGEDASFMVMLRGYYIINNTLWQAS